jgi:hypothetical protein
LSSVQIGLKTFESLTFELKSMLEKLEKIVLQPILDFGPVILVARSNSALIYFHVGPASAQVGPPRGGLLPPLISSKPPPQPAANATLPPRALPLTASNPLLQ